MNYKKHKEIRIKRLYQKIMEKFFRKFFISILRYLNYLEYLNIMNLHQMVFYNMQKKDNFLKYINLRLKTILALQSIIDGPASVFGIDDKETMQRFYVCLLDICLNCKIKITEEEESLIIRIMDSGFIKKRHFPQEVTGSFVKILIQIAKNSEQIRFIYAICYCLKLMIQKFQKTQKMLEEDNEGFGMNSYNVKYDDSSCTNALNSSIFEEIKEIKNKYKNQQKLQSIVTKLLKNEPMPQHMLNKSVYDVYRQ
ncbi:unnamed protein product [Paramecium sonneborni]|uniref:CCAAT-binding factor domain-containing protein n=1 Tax=Paramecium sonneborni TaxID=65129 RepID=A0A8S1NY50_9CILI|nr:unnamed protein product [Paramecium sonneborni]